MLSLKDAFNEPKTNCFASDSNMNKYLTRDTVALFIDNQYCETFKGSSRFDSVVYLDKTPEAFELAVSGGLGTADNPTYKGMSILLHRL